ncbi:MAG: NAD-dependent epimerase/dehydratase family protein [Azospirillum sp.]|nr:NAD-dependent epimerase/dehydratase family protein [Azospirillum sp.]
MGGQPARSIDRRGGSGLPDLIRPGRQPISRSRQTTAPYRLFRGQSGLDCLDRTVQTASLCGLTITGGRGERVARFQYELSGKRVWVAGHKGMAGSAVVRWLATENCQVLTASRAELDLRRQSAVEAWMAANRPDAVVMAAAVVGGIHANSTRPAEFLYDNLVIETNIIQAAHATRVERLLFLGSSCIYPRLAEQPMHEDALLTGPLEPSNQWYAVAKIAGIKLCQAFRRQYGCDFIAAMPTNLYGAGDNFNLTQGHVAAALIAKIHAAKVKGADTVELWGSGTPKREFLYADDLGGALVFLLKHYSGEDHINVGTGTEITIAELADLIAQIVGYRGRFVFDTSKPDGAPRKVMDTSRLRDLGWEAPTGLEDGFRKTYAWYLEHVHEVRR